MEYITETKREFIEIVNFIENKKNNYDERLKVSLEALKKYNSFPKTKKDYCKFEYYRINRQLGALYFETNNQYEDSEKYFEYSLKMFTLDNKLDSETNICITKQMLAKVKLLLYLSSNNACKLIDATNLLNDINNRIKEYNIINYNLNQGITEVQQILANIDNITTKVTFEIPYHLPLREDYNLKFDFEKNYYSINIKSKKSKYGDFIITDNANVYMEKDKYGLINNSIVSINIPSYINPNVQIKVNKEVGNIFLPIVKAIEIYNYFLKNYIISTGKYWLSELNELMIFNFETTITAGNIIIKNIPLSIANGIKISTSKEELNDSDLKRLQEQLQKSYINMWEVAYNNSKSELLIKNYKESIIWINIALENYAYSFVNKVLSKYISAEEIENFITGKQDYDNFYLKDFISLENYQNAIQRDIIQPFPPSTYVMFKKCFNYQTFKISYTQLRKLISTIKDCRNDIVHGKDIRKDLRIVAEKSLESFKKLLDVFKDI